MKSIAIIGNPNCGKSALFNALTGLRQKVANYPGATVERRVGVLPHHEAAQLIDLPGTYSLTPRSNDERITKNVLMGTQEGEQQPDALIITVDATNLLQNLRFALEVKELGIPSVLALNMSDLAARDKIIIDKDKLSEALDMPVIETVAVRKKGLDQLSDAAYQAAHQARREASTQSSTKERQDKARRITKHVLKSQGVQHKLTRQIDAILLHKFFGVAILFAILFFMFQSVFSWAEIPMDMIEGGIADLQSYTDRAMDDGWFKSIVNDAVLAGVGAVIVFLPQILILFLFILFLETTGYMARAAFLMDRLMAFVGLNGRAFIPLLSSFACAIPGIMAARTISNERDRLTTILIAPLMTCSARLPVYTILIGAFIPDQQLAGVFNLKGVVMFGLYILGIISALIVAYVLKRTMTKGQGQTFMMELPKYQMPNIRYILTGLYERARLFLKRAGTIIFYTTIILWLFAQVPFPPEGATEPAINYSFVGMLGSWLEVIFAPIGFNWEISIALIPGMAAREMSVAALGTVYSLSGNEDIVAAQLQDMMANRWSLATALSFLVWFVYAPQCLSTIAVVRRETNGWKWPLFMLGYLFALAYIASFITYNTTLWLTG